jgi:hypothetical protein
MGSLAAAGALSIALLMTTNAATPTARLEDVGVSSERIRRVAETVQRYIDAKDVAGADTLASHAPREDRRVRGPGVARQNLVTSQELSA